MLYKVSKKSKVYGLLSLLLVFSMAAIPTVANAQEKACVITDAGKKVCGKLVVDSNESQPSKPSQPTVKVEYPDSRTGNIQLLKCSRKASIVACKFIVTMEELGGGDSDMNFYSAYGTRISQATDSKGEDYIADKIIVGKSESKEHLRISMVKDQPMSVTLLFKIPPGVNTIKTLSFLSGRVFGSGNDIAARFSNVNISR